MKHKILMTLALLLTAVGGAWAADYYVVGNFTNWSTNPAYKMTLNTECTSTTEYMLTLDLAADAQFKVVKDDGQGQTWYPDGMGNNYGENGELSGAGKYTVYFRPNGDGNQDWFYGVMNVAAAESAPASIITVNDAKTEASFLMPTYDATAEYVIVRDMSVQMTTKVGDGADGADYRIRVKKNEQGEGYVPAEMTPQEMASLITVTDDMEEKDLTIMTDYTVEIFAADTDGKPTGDAIAFADLEPGRYVAIATAADGSTYDGQTAASNIFELYEGCDITFASTNALALKVGDTKYATVTVDEEDMTDNVEYDADLKGLLKEIEPGKTVTLTAAEGMKFMFGGTDDSDSQLTVHDGTTTIYGFYADAYLKSEFVMPAADLSEMSGANISSMTFYASESNVSWGAANFQVFLTEVANPTISAFNGPSTVVYEGPLSIVGGQMTVTFTNPYTYNGGNLLVGVYNRVEGTYVSCNWLGTTVNGASVQGYSYSSLDEIEATQRNFIPKTTFSYKASTLTLEDELSFQMPANDTLVSYTLVRDMKYKVSAEMSSDYIAIVKDGNTYVPVDEEAFLPTVTNKYFDGQEFSMYLDTDYTLRLQKPGEEEGEWSNATIGVGTFRYAVIGKGIFADTIYTEPFRLVEGFEMEIPAGEYKTLFAVEAITTDAEGIELYTVASIEDDKALLSDAISTVPALTPMLVYNAGDKPMTVLLMPTEEEADDVTPAPQFLGTLEGLYMSGSNESMDFYACNGHDFVWVKETGYLAANRCFIQLRKGNDTARQLHIAFPGNATKITTTDFTDYTDGEFYDLNGRKLDKMPTRKGVYIMNGKKVVIK